MKWARPLVLLLLGGLSAGAADWQRVTWNGEPDEDFHPQVYLSGGNEFFIELERLSPLFAPRQHARFEIRFTGTAP